MTKSSIADQLRSIDTSVLERLLAIRQEEGRLAEFRDRAEQLKGQVADVVYRRVSDDYTTRAAALEREASPLKIQARAEYRKLRQLVDHITRTYEQAKLEKEELEFRHAVGEFDAARLEDELKAPQRVLDDCQADMTYIGEHKARFVEALGSEAALDEGESVSAPSASAPVAHTMASRSPAAPVSTPAAASATPAAARATPATASAAPSPAGTGPAPESASPVPSAPAALAAAPQDPPVSPDVTLMMPPEDPGGEATRLVAAPVPTPAPAPALPADDEDGRTLLVPLAALVPDPGALPKTEYRLGALNFVGRADDNQVQIVAPGVSRKHAVITADARGFVLKDLKSQNGVTVNGERITERPLADGDRIEIAGVAMVFRSPWPPPGTKAAGGATGAAKLKN